MRRVARCGTRRPPHRSGPVISGPRSRGRQTEQTAGGWPQRGQPSASRGWAGPRGRPGVILGSARTGRAFPGTPGTAAQGAAAPGQPSGVVQPPARGTPPPPRAAERPGARWPGGAVPGLRAVRPPAWWASPLTSTAGRGKLKVRRRGQDVHVTLLFSERGPHARASFLLSSRWAGPAAAARCPRGRVLPLEARPPP